MALLQTALSAALCFGQRGSHRAVLPYITARSRAIELPECSSVIIVVCHEYLELFRRPLHFTSSSLLASRAIARFWPAALASYVSLAGGRTMS
jgi:hypothetical protein